METNGYIRQSYSCEGKKFVLLEVEDLPARTDKMVSVSFGKPKKKKRSLDANAYHWLLCGKIAKALNTSSDEVHYEMMLRYGSPLTDEADMPVVAALPGSVDIRKTEIYGKLISCGDLNHYLLIKPSRFYDSKEMAELIAGTIDEAKELGIETLTPMELQQMGFAYEK